MIFEDLLTIEISSLWTRYLELCQNPQDTQQKVLDDIIAVSKESLFGKNHDFGSIRTYAEFSAQVNLSEWSDYSQLSEQIQQGAEDVLFSGSTQYFITTSASSGKPKLLPESEQGILAKNLTERLRTLFTLMKYDILSGKILTLTNSGDLRKTACGIPVGTASGLTLMNCPPKLKKLLAFPIELFSISENSLADAAGAGSTTTDAVQDYLLMRFAIESDVRMIVGNNIARMHKLVQIARDDSENIIHDIEHGYASSVFTLSDEVLESLSEYLKPNPQRASELRAVLTNSEFIPKNYWKNFAAVCCWLSGSVGAAVNSVKYLFAEDTKYLDYGYGASEGKFNIPCEAGNSAGPIALHAAFYEFIPVDSDGATVLRLHELEDRKLYEIVITTYSGLYRYKMHDIIQVQGFTEQTPNIVFISKSGDVGNIAGEKLAGSTILNAVRDAADSLNICCIHACAVPLEKDLCYKFCLELASNDIDSNQLLDAIDSELRKDIGYANKRRDNLLSAPHLQIMRSGWLDAIYEQKTNPSVSLTQIKLPVIYKEIPLPEYAKSIK